MSAHRESLHGLVFTTDRAGIGEPAVATSAGASAPADLAIVSAEPWEGSHDAEAALATAWADGGRAIALRVRGVGAFAITRDRILVHAAVGARADLVRLFVRYHAIGLALRLRGFVVLHGAAVSLGGGAHVWVGASGAGKTSAAL